VSSEKSKKKSPQTKKTSSAKILFWLIGLSPLMAIIGLLLLQKDNLPPLEMLENPPELQASIVYADDGKTELGRYWKINRTTIPYNQISPYVTSALISTEDERFYDHSGVDFKALARTIFKMGSKGGGSTISQQLAKLLYTLQKRQEEEDDASKGLPIEIPGKLGRLVERVNEKAQENIIATKLEEHYTKEEIITMYLNQFDFLYNAVGIENAARVYFNKDAKDLSKDEAAMLIGMCKNPTLYNPYSFKIRNYRMILARRQNIDPSKVNSADILAAREKDSSRAADRRNQVLFQWLRNSKKGNKHIKVSITQEEYDQLTKKPLVVHYHSVDHKDGIAPYFRESIRKTISHLLAEKDENGKLKYAKKDGSAWNIYSDGLKIYTTIDISLQKYAEEAMVRHLKNTLQPKFDQNNKRSKFYPFANDIKRSEIDKIMLASIHVSDRYRRMKATGASEEEISKAFHEPTEMSVFSWKGDIDTVMTPYDSIRYYKGFLRAGLMSVEPGTGFVKAWVGGYDMDHFALDVVSQTKRQVGSTIKPFIYASGMTMGVVTPCTTFSNSIHCVDLFDASGKPNGQWCPGNADGKMSGKPTMVKTGLKFSMNNITAAIMNAMGAKAGPQTVAQILKNMNINLSPADIVPAMCLGTMDMSLYEMVAAQATFVNDGIWIEPTTILRIEDRNGNVIYNARPKVTEALNQDVAYATLLMMQGVVNGGTGGSLRGTYYDWGGLKYPLAGKTGTTQKNSDGWFMGLTPNLVTGVWVGGESRAIRFRSMAWGQGGRMALPIFGYFMQKTYADPTLHLTEGNFQKPKDFDNSELNCTAPETTDNTISTEGNDIIF